MLFPYMIKSGYIFLKTFPVFDLSDLVLTLSGWNLGEVNYLGFIPYIFKSHWIGIRSKLLKIVKKNN